MIRLFVGIELPEPVRQQLHLMSSGFDEARWTARGNYHLTLVFIGEVDEPVADDIDTALAAIRDHPFSLKLSGVGQFDRGGHTAILWAGIEANPALDHLHGKVKTALWQLRVPFENRKFAPHVTLARVRPAARQDKVFRYLADHGLFATEPFPVHKFCLFESLRSNDGPIYRPVRDYYLS